MEPAPQSSRAGHFVQQATGYRAFEPAPLPPELLQLNGLSRLLSAADLALGRLDGITGILPNPNLFVAMYVRQEAVLSSQIEGTQASLTDVLEFEAGERSETKLRDVEEVVNYVGAMNYGLEQTALPLSLRLLREIHKRLMKGVRGQRLEPGEFRRTQNWIGPAGCTLSTATFVPPPHHRLLDLMGNLEHFLHDDTLPPLIQAGLAHAQFETIHPFLDGNGRLGRLLITFLLCKRGVLSRPLLYLSYFLKENRTEYYDRLQAVRTSGTWEDWLAFFLRGVRDVATQSHETAKKILALRTRCQALLQQEGKAAAPLLRSLDLLFAQPMLTASHLADELAVSSVTANKYVARMQELKILRETTGFKRNRRFVFAPYIELFEGPKAEQIDPEEIQLPPAPRTPLTPAQLRRVEAAYASFAEFEGSPSLEDWIAEFEKERNPEGEIAVYDAMRHAYEAFCARHVLTAEARREVHLVVLMRSNMSGDEVLARIQGRFTHLSPDLVRELLLFYQESPRPITIVWGRR